MTYALLLVAIVIWGWTFVASKVCLETMSPLQLVASRFLNGAPALYIVARLRRVPFGYLELARPFALGAVVFSVHFLLQTSALELTSATNTGWIVAVPPLTIALLASLVLKEPIPPAMRLGLAMATFGIVLLVSRGELGSLDWLSSVGDWLALVSTLTWAAYTIVTRDLSRARDPVVVAFAMTLPLLPRPPSCSRGFSMSGLRWRRFRPTPSARSSSSDSVVSRSHSGSGKSELRSSGRRKRGCFSTWSRSRPRLWRCRFSVSPLALLRSSAECLCLPASSSRNVKCYSRCL